MPPETAARSAEHVFEVQRHTMLDQIDKVGLAADRSEGTKGLIKETAILQARAIDQACFGMILVVERLNEHVDQLTTRLDASTASTTASANDLAKWTRRLVWATFGLGAAAIIAALIQAYVSFATPPPLVVTIPKP